MSRLYPSSEAEARSQTTHKLMDWMIKYSRGRLNLPNCALSLCLIVYVYLQNVDRQNAAIPGGPYKGTFSGETIWGFPSMGVPQNGL